MELVHCMRKAFREAKKQIASAKVLTHYNPTLPIKLASDASAYGLGAVIQHKMLDGSERPIAFASRTLDKSGENYAQFEKEALSLVYAVKKFHRYLYGRKFIYSQTINHRQTFSIQAKAYLHQQQLDYKVGLCYFQHMIMISSTSCLRSMGMLMDYRAYLYHQMSLRQARRKSPYVMWLKYKRFCLPSKTSSELRNLMLH